MSGSFETPPSPIKPSKNLVSKFFKALSSMLIGAEERFVSHVPPLAKLPALAFALVAVMMAVVLPIMFMELSLGTTENYTIFC
ncbi:MAG: hypothetical protein WDW38_010257 [Sanguina aurantia]